jgi:hypothetical protein
MIPAAPAPSTRRAHRRRPSRDLDRDEGLTLGSTMPPQPTPPMSPRIDDSPRMGVERAGASSRYWRARRERTIADDLADISAYLDGVHASERMDGLQQACGGGL